MTAYRPIRDGIDWRSTWGRPVGPRGWGARRQSSGGTMTASASASAATASPGGQRMLSKRLWSAILFSRAWRSAGSSSTRDAGDGFSLRRYRSSHSWSKSETTSQRRRPPRALSRELASITRRRRQGAIAGGSFALSCIGRSPAPSITFQMGSADPSSHRARCAVAASHRRLTGLGSSSRICAISACVKPP